MNANIKYTYTDFEGNLIEEPQEGQVGYCPETKCAYKYHNGEWVKSSINLNMNVYDMNKQIIAQLNDMSEEKITEAKLNIHQFALDTNNVYYMLLCNDIKYYTLFKVDCEGASEDFSNEVIECVKDIGTIKVIDKAEGAIEIWVHPIEEDSSPLVIYLFPYDGGVVKCQR